jgi:cysteine desulfurase
VPGIVGFGEAVRWCLAHPELRDHRRAARAAFAMKLTGSEFEFTLNDLNQGLETHVHGRFPDIDAETMLIRLDRAGISASSGAACSSGSLEPSHVLMATGRTEQEASEGLRFSFGKANTPEQAERAADNLLGLAEEIYARRRA